MTIETAYLNDVTLDVARQFQADNPHVEVIFCGVPLGEADLNVAGVSFDYDARRRARQIAAKALLGSATHLINVDTSKTIH